MENEMKITEKVDKMKKSKLYKNIKKSLVAQLVNKNDNFLDLIDDYMNFWITKQLLKDDIQERGVTIYYFNAQGNEMSKRNEAVNDITKTNAQMLKILNELGIKANVIPVEDDVDDEL